MKYLIVSLKSDDPSIGLPVLRGIAEILKQPMNVVYKRTILQYNIAFGQILELKLADFTKHVRNLNSELSKCAQELQESDPDYFTNHQSATFLSLLTEEVKWAFLLLREIVDGSKVRHQPSRIENFFESFHRRLSFTALSETLKVALLYFSNINSVDPALSRTAVKLSERAQELGSAVHALHQHPMTKCMYSRCPEMRRQLNVTAIVENLSN